jgi:hypothetical protein
VFLGTLGKREQEGGGTSPLAEHERPIVRRQVTKVVVQSAAIAVVLTVIVLLLPRR